ncbi:MAG: sugar ABC transporter substrate-binding protein [Geobacter sp.]|nr:MAG: sugar ABC transporter substrate-binding protein [Geobacter sp.]
MKKIVLFVLSLVLMAGSAWGGDYVVGEGDSLDISVWGVKELNFTVKVRPDGKVTVPGLGDLQAAGFTPVGLQESLTVKLKELVKNPIVTVSVRDFTNNKVYIFGGGVASGVYDLNRRTTLLQLLCSIGGSGGGEGKTAGDVGAADYKQAYVLRGGKKIKENFYKLFINGDISDDVAIETGDAIFIPRFPDKNVYVVGAVNAPRVIPYRDGMTVLEAILEAGGFTKFASQNSTTVMRKEGGKEISLPVMAKDLIKDGDLAQNRNLRPGDYVIVKEGIF